MEDIEGPYRLSIKRGELHRMKIRVTGFPGITNKEEIKRIFSEKGTVSNVEKEYGKNTAYVSMPYDYQGLKAIHSLDGTRILGRIIKVEEST